ncbi:MAG: hypothetical protein GKR91_19345 [Pseudomonadales bacterium]|nr:hypothetical protein [Pseudomonadales bacterium]
MQWVSTLLENVRSVTEPIIFEYEESVRSFPRHACRYVSLFENYQQKVARNNGTR